MENNKTKMKVLCKKEFFVKEIIYNYTDDFLKNHRNEDYEILLFKKDCWYDCTFDMPLQCPDFQFNERIYCEVISDVPTYMLMHEYNRYVHESDMEKEAFDMERLVYNDIFNLPMDYASENDYFADYFYTENDLRKEKIKRLGGKIVGS